MTKGRPAILVYLQKLHLYTARQKRIGLSEVKVKAKVAGLPKGIVLSYFFIILLEYSKHSCCEKALTI
jgi:hypothetical protein